MNKRKPNHPGVILKQHYMVPLHLSVSKTAIALGVSRKTISNLVNGHVGVTPDLALRMSRAFNTSPELWLNLQQAFTLWEAAHQSKKWLRVPVLHLQEILA